MKKPKRAPTDKERLDWLDNQRMDFKQGDGVYYRAGDYYDLSHPLRSVRELIDAAMRGRKKR